MALTNVVALRFSRGMCQAYRNKPALSRSPKLAGFSKPIRCMYIASFSAGACRIVNYGAQLAHPRGSRGFQPAQCAYQILLNGIKIAAQRVVRQTAIGAERGKVWRAALRRGSVANVLAR